MARLKDIAIVIGVTSTMACNAFKGRGNVSSSRCVCATIAQTNLHVASPRVKASHAFFHFLMN